MRVEGRVGVGLLTSTVPGQMYRKESIQQLGRSAQLLRLYRGHVTREGNRKCVPSVEETHTVDSQISACRFKSGEDR